jgi:Glycosyltransferase Family 4
LRILITNAFLESYTGTEVAVRDMALELKRHGHDPVIYSPRLGAIAREVANAGIVTTDDIRSVATPPDIIHGQHHAQVIEALLQFPDTPAIYVCHDATSPLDTPFAFPRILRWVAVDLPCRKRIEATAGISPQRIEVIENAVDLNRFQARPDLPAVPKRALAFSNSRRQVPAVRRACWDTGLEVSALGIGTKTAVPNPQSILPQYDIVFAKARCALEAMAVGCAVVLCDFAGVGPMVTSANFEQLRRMNFGQAALLNPLHPSFVAREIVRYDPEDAAEVHRRARNEAGLDAAVRRWTSLYADVVAEFRSCPRESSSAYAAEFHALAEYLRAWSYQGRVRWEHGELEKLQKIPAFGNAISFVARKALGRLTRT